jgi:hypothetical protein
VQLRGRPSRPPSALGSSLSCGSSLCFRCSTSKVSHTYGEEALRLRTTRSMRSSRRERGGGGDDGCLMAYILWLRPLPLLYRCNTPGVS